MREEFVPEKNAVYISRDTNQLIERESWVDEESINLGQGPFKGILTVEHKDSSGVLVDFKGEEEDRGINFKFYLQFGEFYSLAVHENYSNGVCRASIRGSRNGKMRAIRVIHN